MKPVFMSTQSRIVKSAICALCVVALAGCHWDMWDNARIKPLEKSPTSADGSSTSMPVKGTVSYGGARTDSHYYAGLVDGAFAMQLPDSIELDRALLERGRNRFQIYCIVCHGATGQGDGMVVRRGFPQPPAYVDLLRREPPADQVGYYFDVMTNGFGRMFSYATRISVEDRWAIAAYIRVLQLSQHATPDVVPASVIDTAKNPPVEEVEH